LFKDIKTFKFNAMNSSGGATRNSALNRKDMSTNMWKPTQPINAATMETDEEEIPSNAFGTGHFYQGLKNEIYSLDRVDLMLP
jgi:hypothetical protein